MNRIDFTKFKQAIIWEFRFLRKRLSHGETTIKVDINGSPIVLISVSESFSTSKCDPCFNQLICTLRETINTCSGMWFVNQCLFYRDEPVELWRLSEGPKLDKMINSMKDKDK